jgi:hypothetical protein
MKDHRSPKIHQDELETQAGSGTSESSLPTDPTRRKLMRSAAAFGGLLAAGSLPWESPAVKSFFGARAAWAQPTPDFACRFFAVDQNERCGNPMNTFCVDIGLLTQTRIVAYLQNIGTQTFEVTDVALDSCPGANAPLPGGPQVQITPPTPNVPVTAGELVPLTLQATACQGFSGAFEVCVFFTTIPPNLCIPLRVRGQCP